MKNVINWFEIPCKDINRAKEFYQNIFDIEMMDLDVGDGTKMVLFPVEAGKVGGALVHNSNWYHPSRTHGPLIYLNANPDLLKIQEKVNDFGGSVVISKRAITEDFGFMAVIEDTEGNRIALHSGD